MNNYAEMYSRVKNLMIRLGFNIVDQGIPEIKEFEGKDWIYGEPIAAYLVNDHSIVIRSELKDLADPIMFDELLAHEICHSLQGLTAEIGTELENFVIDDKYWELPHEREAYTIGGLYAIMYCLEGTIDNVVYTYKMQKIERMITNGEIDKLVNEFIGFYKKAFSEQKIVLP